MKALALLFCTLLSSGAATLLPQWKINDEQLAKYFDAQTAGLAQNCLAEIKTADDWKQRAPEFREQLAEMLGLSPMPARTDMRATVTGRVERDAFTVENLHFQSMPGLYVTANLYIPKGLTKPAPTVLYVCGHGPMITNRVSYGTKVTYQHHGIWFARNGYVCLVIDTLESGEILGEHHGTYRQGMWWWNARGYSPGGVETWNNIRALDYLSTRSEVDTNRFAVTGRSGGGAYSWYLMAMDDRIKAAAPVAGITDLGNHVVDGCVEGHCDCMFFVNTYRWDYPMLAALAVPRPLLFCNTDDDNIFPLDGVVRTYDKMRRVYELLRARDKLGIVITPGPHKDTQELQVPVMRWFDKHLKGEQPLIETAAVKLFAPQELKVFDKLPADAINTNIHFSFVAKAAAELPRTKSEWQKRRDTWLAELREKSFRAWPENMEPPKPRRVDKQEDDLNRARYEFLSEPGVTLHADVRRDSGSDPDRVILRVVDAGSEPAGDTRPGTSVIVQASARPIAGSAAVDAKKQVQIRRRYMLLGQTLDSMRVWDIRRTIQAIQSSRDLRELPLRIEAEGAAAVNALYASLFESGVNELVLTRMPASHMNGPDYLNVLRVLDIPQAVAMASERCRVELRGVVAKDWTFVADAAKRFGWEKNLRFSDADSASSQ